MKATLINATGRELRIKSARGGSVAMEPSAFHTASLVWHQPGGEVGQLETLGVGVDYEARRGTLRPAVVGWPKASDTLAWLLNPEVVLIAEGIGLPYPGQLFIPGDMGQDDFGQPCYTRLVLWPRWK